MADHYSVLGVAQTATLTEIKKAYMALALVAHPDKGGNPAKFILIQKAWETLRDPDARHDYDADLREAERKKQRAKQQKEKERETRRKRYERPPETERQDNYDSDRHAKTKPTGPTRGKWQRREEYYYQDDNGDDHYSFYFHSDDEGSSNFKYTRTPKSPNPPKPPKSPNEAKPSSKSGTEQLKKLQNEALDRQWRFEKGINIMKTTIPEASMPDDILCHLYHVRQHLQNRSTAMELTVMGHELKELRDGLQPGSALPRREVIADAVRCLEQDRKLIYHLGNICLKFTNAAKKSDPEVFHATTQELREFLLAGLLNIHTPPAA